MATVEGYILITLLAGLFVLELVSIALRLRGQRIDAQLKGVQIEAARLELQAALDASDEPEENADDADVQLDALMAARRGLVRALDALDAPVVKGNDAKAEIDPVARTETLRPDLPRVEFVTCAGGNVPRVSITVTHDAEQGDLEAAIAMLTRRRAARVAEGAGATQEAGRS